MPLKSPEKLHLADTLYIRLSAGADDASVQYAVASDGQRPVSRTGTLADALALVTGKKLLLFAPMSEVRLARFEIAARDTQKILQAAPYALEEQFAEDVDTLHFAIGTRESDGRIPVAVVARATMDAWLAPFTAAGVHPTALYPDLYGLPTPQDVQWTALAEPEVVTVRSGTAAGFVCTPDTLDSYLQLAPLTQNLQLQICEGCDTDFTRLSRPVELRPGWPRALDCLIAHLNLDTAINLLQGTYSAQRDFLKLWKPWRLAAALAVVWLTLTLTGVGISAWRDARELQRLDDANLQRFQSLFPSETRIVDLPAQAEQQLTMLKGGDTGAGLFSLLDAAAAGLASEAGLSLQTLQFREGALYLSLTGNDLQALERLREWFGQRAGVRLEVQSANSSSLGVQIRLKLSPA